MPSQPSRVVRVTSTHLDILRGTLEERWEQDAALNTVEQAMRWARNGVNNLMVRRLEQGEDVKDRELVDAAIVVAIKALQGNLIRPNARDDESIQRLASECMEGLGNDLVVRHHLGSLPRFKGHDIPADLLIDGQTLAIDRQAAEEDTDG